jgi:uncharacterized protein YdaU (DUF1376 family)
MTKKAPWVKWYPDQFLGGIAGLTAEEIGVYSFLLNMIYDRGGPISADLQRIAARVRMRPTSLTSVLESLQDQGKIEISAGGMISNPRAVQEIETRSKVLEKWTENLSAADAKLKEISNKNNGTRSAPAEAPAPPTAVETQNQIKKERKKDSRPAKAQDAPYSEEFEDLWKQYPRTRNTSKKKAWDYFRMLDFEKQQKVRAAVPLFGAAMRAEGRPEDKIAHMTTWLNGRMYETAVPTADAAGAPTKTYKEATREEWQKVLNVWAIDSHWRSTWGPEPGKPGCAVPEDLMAAHNVKHRGFMFSDEEIERFKKIAGSQTRVSGNAGKAST